MESRIGRLRNDLLVGRLVSAGRCRRFRHRQHLVDDTAIEEDRILDAQFGTEFIRVTQFDLNQQRLNDHLRRGPIEFADDALNLGHIARTASNQQTVGGSFGHDDLGLRPGIAVRSWSRLAVGNARSLRSHRCSGPR